jgi:hypothetical protein
MSMAELVDGLRARTLTERSLVWRQGMQEWATVDAVPQLKLAARLTPARAAVAQARPPEKPSSPAPQTPRPTSSPHAGLSRRSTLPFGLPAPPGSRPSHAKPSLPQSSLSPDEPEVLAVYARPAATISFDLSPEQPLRAPGRSSASAPQTLAPTTTDSSPRSAAPQYRVADLSVVAAADYRAVQRSGKRRVLLWSVGSAAAASLLTFWLSRSSAPQAPLSAAPQAGQALTAPAAAPSTAPARSEPAAPAVAAAVSAEPAASTAPSAKASAVAPSPPKAHRPVTRKRKVVVAPAEVAPSEPAVGEVPSAKSPASEPNPYDVKLEDEAPKPAATQRPAAEAPTDSDASSATSPGF